MHVKIFICPIHGYELNVMCWRAFSEEYFNKWKITSTEPREATAEEQESIKKDLAEYRRSAAGITPWN